LERKSKWRLLRSLGSDASGVRKGDLVMRHGDWISRGEGGECTLAFVGRKEVGIFLLKNLEFKPNNFYILSRSKCTGNRSSLLGTGDEIVDLHSNVANTH
jgi:hypothetical protein